jgi:hypothetical protein
MIFNNDSRKQFSDNQMKSLDSGQRDRLYEHKRKRGLIVNPPLKGKRIMTIINGEVIRHAD